jgi:hypothetical protein
MLLGVLAQAEAGSSESTSKLPEARNSSET